MSNELETINQFSGESTVSSDLILPTDEQVRRYTATANTYDQVSFEFRSKNMEAVNLIQPEISDMLKYASFGGKILDAGCGAGVYTNLIASLGYQTVGIDISERQISLAESMTDNPNIIFRRENLVESKIEKEEYDGILYNSSFHHILKQDRKALLMKLNQGMKEQARMLLITRAHPESKEEFIETVKLGKKTGRIASRSTKEELFALLQECNFVIEQNYHNEPHPDDPEGIFQHLLLRKKRSIEGGFNVSDLVIAR